MGVVAGLYKKIARKERRMSRSGRICTRAEYYPDRGPVFMKQNLCLGQALKELAWSEEELEKGNWNFVSRLVYSGQIHLLDIAGFLVIPALQLIRKAWLRSSSIL